MSSIDFSKSNLQKANFRGSNCLNVDFTNCDLTSASFVRTQISQSASGTKRTSFKGATMFKTNFQETVFPENLDFVDADLRRVNFKGCDLTNMNFDGADLDSAEFYFATVTGANFDRANLTGANVNVAIGSGEIVRHHDHDGNPVHTLDVLPPTDTHNAFYRMNMPELLKIFENNNLNIDRAIVDSNTNMNTYINNHIRDFINNLDMLPANKDKIERGYNRCYVERLNREANYIKRVTAQTQVTWAELIYYTIEYVLLQPDYFQDNYVIGFVEDSIHAHDGNDGLSCVGGVMERLVTSIGKSAEAAIRTVEIESRQKKSEYKKLIKIINIQPITESSSDSRSSDSPVNVIDLGEYFQEWYTKYDPDGDDPDKLSVDITPEEVGEHYKNFLYEKLRERYDRLSDRKKLLFDEMILKDIRGGVDVIKQQHTEGMLFGGGRRLRRRTRTRRTRTRRTKARRTRRRGS